MIVCIVCGLWLCNTEVDFKKQNRFRLIVFAVSVWHRAVTQCTEKVYARFAVVDAAGVDDNYSNADNDVKDEVDGCNNDGLPWRMEHPIHVASKIWLNTTRL